MLTSIRTQVWTREHEPNTKACLEDAIRFLESFNLSVKALDQLANWYSQVDERERSDFADALMTHELAIDCNNILTEFNSPFDLQMLEDT